LKPERNEKSSSREWRQTFLNHEESKLSPKEGISAVGRVRKVTRKGGGGTKAEVTAQGPLNLKQAPEREVLGKTKTEANERRSNGRRRVLKASYPGGGQIEKRGPPAN